MIAPHNSYGGLSAVDRISEALLKEFVEGNNLTKLKEDKQFEHLAAYLAVRRFYSDQFDTFDVVTGAGDDTSIDGFAALVNGRLIADVDELDEIDRGGTLDVTFVFIQAERSSGFDGAKIGNFGTGAVDFFKPEPKLRRNDHIKEAVKLMNAIYDRGNEFKKGNPVCRLEYITTGKWLDDEALLGRIAIIKEDLEKLNQFERVEFVPSGAVQLQALYRQAQNVIERNFKFDKAEALPAIPNVQESYIGYMPASEFLKLVVNDDGDIMPVLFLENPRDWLDYNEVNLAISETLDSESKTRFVLMNNGVTIIASELRPKGENFFIGGYSIVNGCQTSHVLFDAKDQLDDTVMIPVRLIATQDEDVINDIIKATNTQTEVKDEQFFALRKFSKRLEEYFNTYAGDQRLFYERRTGQYARLNIEKTRIINAPTLIRTCAAMFLQEPHRATKNYKDTKRKVGKEILADEHRLEPYYVAALAYYKLDLAFRTRRIDAAYKSARFHLLMAMRILANNDPLPRMNENKMEGYCKDILAILWDKDKTEALIASAVEIIENAAGGDLNRDNIRIEPFTKSVLTALGSPEVIKDEAEAAG